MKQLHERIAGIFPVRQWEQQRANLAFLNVDCSQLRPLLAHLRDREGFTHLVLLTAVDWLEDERFQLTYLLYNRTAALDIGVRVHLPRDAANMESVHELWPTASTYQRELREMFGIDFPGSPGIGEDFILEGWREIPPYRRDFDTLRYAEERFSQRPGRETHEPAEFMKQRLYPEGQ
jgi:NADH-quinone oxidoreductase subunit C